MIRAFLFDADGVTFVRKGYFSERLADELSIPSDRIAPFFRDDYRKCQTGEADILSVLPPYLSDWGWQGGVKEFLLHWFKTDTEIDQAVIARIDELRAQGIKCYLVSDQEKYRAAYLREAFGLDQHFDGLFFSCDLGLYKSDPQFFKHVLKAIGEEPSTVKYCDDDPHNVDAAASLGIDARFYTGHETLEQ